MRRAAKDPGSDEARAQKAAAQAAADTAAEATPEAALLRAWFPLFALLRELEANAARLDTAATDAERNIAHLIRQRVREAESSAPDGLTAALRAELDRRISAERERISAEVRAELAAATQTGNASVAASSDKAAHRSAAALACLLAQKGDANRGSKYRGTSSAVFNAEAIADDAAEAAKAAFPEAKFLGVSTIANALRDGAAILRGTKT